MKGVPHGGSWPGDSSREEAPISSPNLSLSGSMMDVEDQLAIGPDLGSSKMSSSLMDLGEATVLAASYSARIQHLRNVTGLPSPSSSSLVDSMSCDDDQGFCSLDLGIFGASSSPRAAPFGSHGGAVSNCTQQVGDASMAAFSHLKHLSDTNTLPRGAKGVGSLAPPLLSPSSYCPMHDSKCNFKCPIGACSNANTNSICLNELNVDAKMEGETPCSCLISGCNVSTSICNNFGSSLECPQAICGNGQVPTCNYVSAHDGVLVGNVSYPSISQTMHTPPSFEFKGSSSISGVQLPHPTSGGIPNNRTQTANLGANSTRLTAQGVPPHAQGSAHAAPHPPLAWTKARMVPLSSSARREDVVLNGDTILLDQATMTEHVQ